MNEYVGADALHPPAMSRFYRDDVGIVPYKKMHNLPYKSSIYLPKKHLITYNKGENKNEKNCAGYYAHDSGKRH